MQTIERRDVLAEVLEHQDSATEQALKHAEELVFELCDRLMDLHGQCLDANDWALVHGIGPAWGDAINAMCDIGRLRKSFRS